MRFNERIIRNYKEYINSNYSETSIRYDAAKSDRLIFQNLIISFKNHTYDNVILNQILIVNANVDAEFDIVAIKKLRDNINSGTNYKHIINYTKATKDEAIIIKSYYISFCKALVEELICKSKLEEITDLDLPEETIRKLTNNYFAEVSTLLLLEPNIKFNLNPRLSISIKGKSRNKKRYNGKAKVAPYDWGTSIENLKIIAAKHNPKLVEDYKNKLIRRKEFIIEAKKYGYNKDTNPDGEKWLTRIDKAISFWVLLNKSVMCTSNESLYAIIPSSCRHVGDLPLNTYITERLGTREAVIADTALGFVDKIRALEKLDFAYCLNTFDNDL